jgi:hypothetical protein
MCFLWKAPEVKLRERNTAYWTSSKMMVTFAVCVHLLVIFDHHPRVRERQYVRIVYVYTFP